MTITLSVLLNMLRHLLGLSYLTLVVLTFLSCLALYVVALRFWARPMRFIADNIYDSLAALLAFPVITMVIVYLLPVYPAQNFSNHPIYCTVMMLMVELGFSLYLYTFYRNLRQISILSKQELKWQLLQTEIASYQDYLQAAKQNRHDLRHHDALILEYLEDGNIQGAMEYLHAHNDALTASALRQFSKNPTANILLRLYERRAQESGVAFSAVADFPEPLSLTAPELGGLLGNLLENALDACKASQRQDRYISFSAMTQGTSLLLELRNTVEGQTSFWDGMPISQKPGGGTGTRSVAATVKKYGGMVDFSQRGNEFFTRIILPL